MATKILPINRRKRDGRKSIRLAALVSISVFGMCLEANAQDSDIPASYEITQPDEVLDVSTMSTLEILFRSAYSNHPALSSLWEQSNASKEGIIEARGSYFPQVTVNGSISQAYRQGELQTGFDFDQTTTPQSLSLNLSQTLYNGGRRKLATRSASYVAEASHAQFLDSATQIAAEIIQDYMSLYRAQKEVEIFSETVATLEDLEAIVIARREIGDAVRTDVSQANSELIRARARLASSEADIANMRSTIQSKTGQFIGTATLPTEAASAVPYDVGVMKRMARAGSAALEASKFTMLSREVTVKSEKRKRRPTISLEANASTRRDTTPTILSDDDVNVGISFSMPLYTGGIGASQTRQAVSLYNAARYDYQNAGRLIDLQVHQYWTQLKSNRTVIEAQRASVSANAETLTSVREGQKAGITSSQDVLDAARNKLTADLELATAEYEQYTLRLLLRLLIGEIGVQEFE